MHTKFAGCAISFVFLSTFALLGCSSPPRDPEELRRWELAQICGADLAVFMMSDAAFKNYLDSKAGESTQSVDAELRGRRYFESHPAFPYLLLAASKTDARQLQARAKEQSEKLEALVSAEKKKSPGDTTAAYAAVVAQLMTRARVSCQAAEFQFPAINSLAQEVNAIALIKQVEGGDSPSASQVTEVDRASSPANNAAAAPAPESPGRQADSTVRPNGDSTEPSGVGLKGQSTISVANGTGSADGTPATTGRQTEPENKTTQETAPLILARPPFRLTDDKLAAAPKGVDLEGLLATLARNPPPELKTEFETADDYEQRLQKWEKKWSGRPRLGERFAVIRRGNLMKGKYETSFNAAYEPNAQTMSVTLSFATCGFLMHETWSYGKRYQASNVFGAMVTVVEVFENSLCLSADESVGALSFFVPKTQAASVLSRLSVVFIVTLKRPYIESHEYTLEPTWQRPTLHKTSYKSLEVQLEEVWIVDSQSGRVLVKERVKGR